jgi:uncharacterized repeat protein (TIGR03806 family)
MPEQNGSNGVEMLLHRIAAVVLEVLFLASLRSACMADQSDGPDSTSRTDGIGTRTPWTTSRIVGSPDPEPAYRVAPAYPSLKFTRPVDITNASGMNRLFVAELEGKIYSFPNDALCNRADCCIDIRKAVSGATNVYGLTFHPDFARRRYAYVCYVLKDGDPNGTRVSRFTVSETDPPTFDPNTERVIITWLAGGHNGGCLKFGPDGCLYIATGDATAPSPPDALETGQDLDDLLSCILRIDEERSQAGLAYRVPPDNPFVSVPGARPEIWAYGFRNPWKMSFDRATGQLWAADVGWELWEMVYLVRRGGNYGWSVMEGRQPVRTEAQRGPTPILPPIVAHPHTEAASITGGYVYRGSRLKDLIGAYVYGDYVTGKIWGLRFDGQRVTWHEELVDTPLQIISFAEDNSGELLVMDYESTGRIYRLFPNPRAGSTGDFPRRLSQTGLFTSVKDQTPAPGVIAYSINAPMWADYAVAQRYLAIPGMGKVDFDSTKSWKLPEGAVLAKTLTLNMPGDDKRTQRRIETQILHFEAGTWRPYTYAWNETQDDAELVDAAGADRTFVVRDPRSPSGARRHTWRFAGRTECLLCHNPWAGNVLGINTAQVHRNADRVGTTVDQLEWWRKLGLFANPIAESLEKLPRLADPYDTSQPLENRARAYLHVNCAHCHRFGGGGTALIDLDHAVPTEKTGAIAARPNQGAFGIADAKLIDPGDPYRSVLFYRMAKLGPGRMPRVGAQFVDEVGVALIHDWIAQLDGNGARSGPRAPKRPELDGTLAALCGSSSDATKRTEAIRRLLTSTYTAAFLMHALQTSRLPQSARQDVLIHAKAASSLEVRDLFERFLPESERTARLGTAIEPARILALQGNADRGRQVFFENRSAQCKSCHRVGGAGGTLGPDLTGIGAKRSRLVILDQILNPSGEIAPEYVPYVLERTDGTVATGLLTKRTAHEIILRDATDQPIRVPTEQIQRLAPHAKSLMPELLLRDLSVQEVADLLEFLVSAQ